MVNGTVPISPQELKAESRGSSWLCPPLTSTLELTNTLLAPFILGPFLTPANPFSLWLASFADGERLPLSGNEMDLAKVRSEAQAPLGVSSPSEGEELCLVRV